DGNLVFIDNVVGMVELNGKFFVVQKSDADTIVLPGVDATSWEVYSSAGTIIPLTVKTVHDTDTALDAVLNNAGDAGIVKDFSDALGALDPTADYSEYVTQAVTEADLLYTTANLKTAVDSYETRVGNMYKKRVAALSQGTTDIGSVNPSGHAIAMALLELDRRREIREFRSKLLFQTEKFKIGARVRSAATMYNYEMAAAKLKGTVPAIVAQNKRLRIVEERAQEQGQIERDAAAALWGITVKQLLADALGAIHGVA
ncbi:unnamed protein product, partial [marine sediment metagenome]